MTRIVTTTYRYKPPPPKRKEAPPLPVEVIPSRPAVVRKAKPCNDNRPEAETERLPTVGKQKPAIVTTAGRKPRISDGPPPQMELPLSRQPVERDGDDYKRLKATMARRLRGETK
jgi:hypothetical protein